MRFACQPGDVESTTEISATPSSAISASIPLLEHLLTFSAISPAEPISPVIVQQLQMSFQRNFIFVHWTDVTQLEEWHRASSRCSFLPCMIQIIHTLNKPMHDSTIAYATRRDPQSLWAKTGQPFARDRAQASPALGQTIDYLIWRISLVGETK